MNLTEYQRCMEEISRSAAMEMRELLDKANKEMQRVTEEFIGPEDRPQIAENVPTKRSTF